MALIEERVYCKGKELPFTVHSNSHLRVEGDHPLWNKYFTAAFQFHKFFYLIKQSIEKQIKMDFWHFHDNH